MKYILILILLLIAGCTFETECPTCPECICNYQNQNQSQISEINNQTIETELTKIPLIVYKIYAGKQSVFVTTLETSENNVYDCGSIAYGPSTSDEIKRYIPLITNLIITDTSDEYIGGCPDIIKEHTEIRNVIVYGQERDTQKYKDLISWTPQPKLIKKTDDFVFVYHNKIIDFNNLTETRNEVYGEW